MGPTIPTKGTSAQKKENTSEEEEGHRETKILSHPRRTQQWEKNFPVKKELQIKKKNPKKTQKKPASGVWNKKKWEKKGGKGIYLEKRRFTKEARKARMLKLGPKDPGHVAGPPRYAEMGDRC